MAYVITSPCIGVMDGACAAVCPVDCIHKASDVEAVAEGGQYLFIDPDECIDCGACEPECPVGAIFFEQSVPLHDQDWIKVNRDLAEKLRG